MILYDGAIGTYYRWLFREDYSLLEEVNLKNPMRIKEIHQAYIKAGATKIKTNTFAAFPLMLEKTTAETKQIVDAAYNNAREAISELQAESTVKLVADIGPFFLVQPGLAEDIHLQNQNAYLELVKNFLELGADEFLFETQEQLEDLLPAINLINENNSKAVVTVSFNVNQNGYTRTGLRLRDLLSTAEKIDAITYTGINCSLGPTQLSQVFANHAEFEKFSFFGPNSGLPERDLGRGRGGAEAAYFAKSCQKAWDFGAFQLSGCCGTNPLDIRALADLYKNQNPVKIKKSYKEFAETKRSAQPDQPKSPAQPIEPKPSAQSIEPKPSAQPTKPKQSWYERLLSGEQIIAIEYDTPTKADTGKYLEKVAELKAAGMDLLTIADNPNGQTRIDSGLMAARIHEILGVEVLPHFTCRDRNLVAIHSLLLGLTTCGVHQVLAVTGDPIPVEDRNQIKSVFNVNSQSLLRYITQLNEELTNKFILASALNVNAQNFEYELKKARRKIDSGTKVFLTQPIFTARGQDNLKLAKQELAGHAKFLAGIMPIVSQRNALFMKYEMSGIDIPDELIERYANLDRIEAEKLALEISQNLMQEIAEITDGFYLITPFQRTHLTAKLCSDWKAKN